MNDGGVAWPETRSRRGRLRLQRAERELRTKTVSCFGGTWHNFRGVLRPYLQRWSICDSVSHTFSAPGGRTLKPMIVTLRQIMRQVSAAATLDDATAILVQQVSQAVQIDACAVFLKGAEQDAYTLVAAQGLSQAVIAGLTGSRDGALVKLVGERLELLLDPDAQGRLRDIPDVPDFAGHPRRGHFIGTPLIHYRRLLGVLAAWRASAHPYARDEIGFFVTLGTQLAKAIHEAEAVDGVARLLRGDKRADSFIHGISAACGLAVGKARLVGFHPQLDTIPDQRAEDQTAEESAFLDAIAAAQNELREAGERVTGRVPDAVRALFDVQVMLLGGDALAQDTVEGIRAGNWAPGAWRSTIARHALVFEQMEDPYLRERAADIRDIGQRVLVQMQSRMEPTTAMSEPCILIGETLGLAEIAAIPSGYLAGLVALSGSPLSHMAVLARALGIPAVVGLATTSAGSLEGRSIAVDGDEGRLYVEPSTALVAKLQQRLRNAETRSRQLRSICNLPAETLDKVRVPLLANIGLPADGLAARTMGADGIGLYRTEYSFLLGETLPIEEELVQEYREILTTFAPLPVTLRTLDVGGDKVLPYLPVREDNPFLGCRGIRFSLDQPEIFLIQLRAMLQANAGFGNLQVLFPMIATNGELDEGLGLLARAERELRAEGLMAQRPRVAVMVEVPASVFLVGSMANRVDAFSIGTNDLTQYVLAVDRNNIQVTTPYDSLHPAVLDAIRCVVKGAHRHGKRVSVCGELAGDPAGALLLLGLGVDSLSMSPTLLGEVKRVIRCCNRADARRLAEATLAMGDGFAIHRHVHAELERIQHCSGSG